ncbi:FAD-dependent oxidoreductase [Lichenifustis flavocetrariae]|uniref:FAD-dependent oxidoreductase n=1 Tax=Lichenifustis flavocetrariae TaxID=2949735 RepID=UPI0024A6F88F|nr:FAD-dependent oxidoreductase [Lichenifustis flavocetrariae]
MDLFDVAVVGGGITGASSANHLVAAGYSVVLLEQGDFASGTTGRTSRLQYSGLSYLGALQPLSQIARHPFNAVEAVGLARRSMRDRSAFIRSVPERVRPVPFFLPIYRDGPVSLRSMMLGFRLMERLDPDGVPLSVEVIEPSKARRDPRLQWLRDPDRLTGVVQCIEHQFDWPERICVDAVFNAAENGATVENHSPVQALARQKDGTWLTTVWDKRQNAARHYRSRAVLNAAGAWVDKIAASSELGIPKVNQGEKGSNVVVRLPPEFEGIGFESLTRGGAPFYVIPWGKLHYFGPANRPSEPDNAGYTVSEDEILFLLEEFNFLFPSLDLQRSDVRYSWAGVRPRTARRGFASGGSAVRLHDFGRDGAANYFAYTGGLLMTHRSAGREVVAGIGRKLPPSGSSRPFLGSARLPPTQADSTTLRASDGDVAAKGLVYACQHEKVRDLADLMRRRVSIGWGEHLGCDVAHQVASTVRDAMGWSAGEAAAEANRYIETTQQQFGLCEAV